jgi:uncharacterized protein YdeI (YjbR/CyaY-like superfamily)
MNEMPPDIRDALEKDAEAARVFEKLPPSHKREYLHWIEEAKKPGTRLKRVGSMMERLKAPRGG